MYGLGYVETEKLPVCAVKKLVTMLQNIILVDISRLSCSSHSQILMLFSCFEFL